MEVTDKMPQISERECTVKKVLVIEDDGMVRNYILKLLQKEGYETRGADNGMTGLEEVRRNIPDLIICDITMPLMDGYSVLEELRKDLLTATIPFIFLTALEDRAHMRRGMEEGADDYLTKPFTREELVRALKAQESKQTAVHKKFQANLDNMRRNLTMSIPHEMLTPLSGILGASNILLDEQWALDQKEIHDMAQIIQQSATRLQRLIQNYVIYTQLLMAEHNPAYRRNFLQSRRELMRDSCAYLKALVESGVFEVVKLVGREEDITLTLEEAPAQILEDDVKKIVYELTSNAFKFSKKGSPVIIKGENLPGRYRLSISDKGLGMKKEQLEQAGAFVQHERRIYEQQGSGLGLTVAKALTEIYEGEFLMESIPGEGTSVTVTFPLS